MGRALLDYGNGVIGLARRGRGGAAGAAGSASHGAGPGAVGAGARPPDRPAGRVCELAGWPVGTVTALGTPDGETGLDDLFAVDLAAAADTATARRGSVGRAALVSSLHRLTRQRLRPRGRPR